MPQQGRAAHIAVPTQLEFLTCLMALGVTIHPTSYSPGAPMAALWARGWRRQSPCGCSRPSGWLVQS